MNNKNGTQYAENAIQAIETLHKEYLDMVEKVEMLEKEKKEGYKIPSDCMVISKDQLEEMWGFFESAQDEADYAYRANEEAQSNIDSAGYHARDGRKMVSELIDQISEKQREGGDGDCVGR
tara:strand:+ start:60 stop:422 length:363 start_codon:yes stop_codon:yes gene_type:complete